MAGVPLAAASCAPTEGGPSSATPTPRASEASVGAEATAAPAVRTLGRTGATVEAFSLGGEGILRTNGREREAVPMILEALRLGVRYCDTAPAYASSQDYYGLAFREAGPSARDKVFLATKTHVRDREGALRLLDDSLRRLGTDRVDLWQMHDLRTADDLDAMFAKGGVIEAAERAKKEGRIRFVGITGHHDPAILVEAMGRYDFDTVLCAINPADPRRMPFVTSVVPEARKRKMGIIGMKALAVGRLVADGVATPAELLTYTASFADTVIIGCKTPNEVAENIANARAGRSLDDRELRALEARVAPSAERYDTFKA
ncbi:MAG: aldo/keto reductase [Polyangiaceae bacterium]|nr:aldo/keto reductase [Polyangiaceae bacterium]